MLEFQADDSIQLSRFNFLSSANSNGSPTMLAEACFSPSLRLEQIQRVFGSLCEKSFVQQVLQEHLPTSSFQRFRSQEINSTKLAPTIRELSPLMKTCFHIAEIGHSNVPPRRDSGNSYLDEHIALVIETVDYAVSTLDSDYAESALASSAIHDIVEDSELTLEQIGILLKRRENESKPIDQILEIVGLVTNRDRDVYPAHGGNKEEIKQYRKREAKLDTLALLLRSKSIGALLVKVGDRLANFYSLYCHGKKYPDYAFKSVTTFREIFEKLRKIADKEKNSSQLLKVVNNLEECFDRALELIVLSSDNPRKAASDLKRVKEEPTGSLSKRQITDHTVIVNLGYLRSIMTGLNRMNESVSIETQGNFIDFVSGIIKSSKEHDLTNRLLGHSFFSEIEELRDEAERVTQEQEIFCEECVDLVAELLVRGYRGTLSKLSGFFRSQGNQASFGLARLELENSSLFQWVEGWLNSAGEMLGGHIELVASREGKSLKGFKFSGTALIAESPEAAVSVASSLKDWAANEKDYRLIGLRSVVDNHACGGHGHHLMWVVLPSGYITELRICHQGIAKNLVDKSSCLDEKSPPF